MTTNRLHVPILFLIFNRPDTTQQVFNEIRKAQPTQLFVSADGPRKDRPADKELCKKTRDIIHQVDWDCTVFTRFQDSNGGDCLQGVSDGITWFFSKVDEGIIIEDDRIPNQSFFPFCQNLLEYYRNDSRVLSILGGSWFLDANIRESYYLSRYHAVGIFATWKRAWELYDAQMTNWPELRNAGILHEIFHDYKTEQYHDRSFQGTYTGEIKSWDYQWVYSCLLNNGLSITPRCNLVSDIGVTGTHSIAKNKFHFMPTKELDTFNIIHPDCMIPNYKLERAAFEIQLKDYPPLWKDLKKRIGMLVNK
jgi:hypothetical protein